MHALMSYHAADSDVSRINRCAFDAPGNGACAHLARAGSGRGNWPKRAMACSTSAIAPTLTRLGFLPRHADFPRISRPGRLASCGVAAGQPGAACCGACASICPVSPKGYAVDLAIQALTRSQACSAGARQRRRRSARCSATATQTVHVRHPLAHPPASCRWLQLHAGARRHLRRLLHPAPPSRAHGHADDSSAQQRAHAAWSAA